MVLTGLEEEEINDQDNQGGDAHEEEEEEDAAEEHDVNDPPSEPGGGPGDEDGHGRGGDHHGEEHHNDDHSVAGNAHNNDAADDDNSDPAKDRARVLKAKLVDLYLTGKAADPRINNAPALKAPAGPSKHMERLSVATDVIGALGGVATAGMSFGGVDDTIQKPVNGGVSALTNTLGAISSFYGLHRSRKGLGSKNKRKASAARFGVAANTFVGAGKLGSAFNGAIGTGFKPLQGLKGHSPVIGAVSSGSVALGAGLSIINNFNQRSYFRNAAANAGRFADEGDRQTLTDKDNDIRTLKNRLETDPNDEEAKAALEQAKADRNEQKARLFAMRQAKILNEQKGNNSIKGVGTGIASALGLFSSIVKTTPLAKSSIFSIALPILSAVTPAIKLLGGMSDRSAAKEEGTRFNEKRVLLVNRYLVRKKRKVREDLEHLKSKEGSFSDNDLRDLRVNNASEITLTDNEAESIAAARLGVEVEIENARELNEQQKNEVFRKMSLRRARNIYNSANKDDMISALGLENNAGINDIAEALMAE